MPAFSFPPAFAETTRQLMGDALFERYRSAMGELAPASIRLNPFKADVEAVAQRLTDDGAQRIGWCPEGFMLTDRPAFTFDPLLHAGRYYVQESSSMFIGYVLRQLIHRPVLMLDLCAAPGGKTTAARTALPDGSIVVANEPMKLRASILKENVEKFGHPDMLVTNNYARDFNKAGLQFDVVATDVPCSGEGMFRRDAGAVAQWSPSLVESCARQQREIVGDIWPCLRPGGLLIYSTCTLNRQEDEDNVAWIVSHLGAEPVDIDKPAAWHISGALCGSLPVNRFIPGLTPGEGLFMAVLRKPGAAEESALAAATMAQKPKHKERNKGGNRQDHAQLSNWLNGDFAFDEAGEVVRVFPARWAPYYNKLKARLHLIHAGVAVGQLKGKKLIPAEGLALSTVLRPTAFARVDVDYAAAISYLRKEALTLPADTPQGIVLLTYRQAPLGFAKNLGSRANNLYPQEWKIKSSHVPAKE